MDSRDTEKNFMLANIVGYLTNIEKLKSIPRAEKNYLFFCCLALVAYIFPGIIATGIFAYGSTRYFAADKPKQDDVVNEYLKRVKSKGFFSSENLLDGDQVKLIGGKEAIEMAISTRINKV